MIIAALGHEGRRERQTDSLLREGKSRFYPGETMKLWRGQAPLSLDPLKLLPPWDWVHFCPTLMAGTGTESWIKHNFGGYWYLP